MLFGMWQEVVRTEVCSEVFLEVGGQLKFLRAIPAVPDVHREQSWIAV